MNQSDPITRLQGLKTNEAINTKNRQRADIYDIMNRRVNSVSVIVYDGSIGSRKHNIKRKPLIISTEEKNGEYETWALPFNPMLQSIEQGENINSVRDNQLFSSRSLHSGQYIYDFRFRDGDVVNWGTIVDHDEHELVYINNSDDQVYIVDTLEYKNESFATQSDSDKYRRNLMATPGGVPPSITPPSSLWNSSNFSDIHLANPQMKYVSLMPNQYTHQLPQVFSSPKHAERSGSYYPAVQIQIHASMFDVHSFPGIHWAGRDLQTRKEHDELSWEGIDFRILDYSDKTITPGLYDREIGWKVPKGWFVSGSGLVSTVKYYTSSYYKPQDLMDSGYYYHFEVPRFLSDGEINNKYIRSLQMVDVRMRETMPAWRNLLGDLYTAATIEVTTTESADFYKRTGRRTQYGDGTPESIIVVHDPNDGGRLPFVDFLDAGDGGGIEPINEPEIFKPPNFEN